MTPRQRGGRLPRKSSKPARTRRVLYVLASLSVSHERCAPSKCVVTANWQLLARQKSLYDLVQGNRISDLEFNPQTRWRGIDQAMA